MFYDNDVRIVGINPIWVQGMLTTLVWMFEQLGLYINLWNTNSVTFTCRFIWGEMGKEAYKRQVAVEGSKFW